MTTRLFSITAVALTVVLSACAASAPLRVAALQMPAPPSQGGTARASLDCGYDDGGFGTPDAMKLPKNAFSSCWPQ